MSAARRNFESQEAVESETGGREILVRVRAVKKTFGSSERTGKQVLAGASLELGAGEIVGLVGESGSGKTTLARCIVALEVLDGGEIEIVGMTIDSRRLDAEQRRRLRSAVQLVFQDPYASLNPMHTVGAALLEALRRRQPDAGREAVTALLSRVGLGSRHAHVKPAYLSGGERQRVAIARALAVDPRVLICDEPVSALDVSVQAQILTLIRSLGESDGVACLFITHDLAVARQVADRLYVMKDGRVVESGSASDVLGSPQHPYSQQLVNSIPQPSHAWLGGSDLEPSRS